jgi:hypothetical protein
LVRFIEEASTVLINYTAQEKPVLHMYEAVMLSHRGAERQRKSHLALAVLFNKAIDDKLTELRAEGALDTHAKNSSNMDHRQTALELCFDEYNSYQDVATQKRWQLRDDDKVAVQNLALHTSEEVRVLMFSHLDYYKGSESGTPNMHCVGCYVVVWFGCMLVGHIWVCQMCLL